jgi:hypothetical protein
MEGFTDLSKAIEDEGIVEGVVPRHVSVLSVHI